MDSPEYNIFAAVHLRLYPSCVESGEYIIFRRGNPSYIKTRARPLSAGRPAPCPSSTRLRAAIVDIVVVREEGRALGTVGTRAYLDVIQQILESEVVEIALADAPAALPAAVPPAPRHRDSLPPPGGARAHP